MIPAAVVTRKLTGAGSSLAGASSTLAS
jgi:hypothetical protein